MSRIRLIKDTVIGRKNETFAVRKHFSSKNAVEVFVSNRGRKALITFESGEWIPA